jgi:predicted Rossmann fold nucleotide-binding protein DprA/Smf involved in DNA uptake
MRTESAGTISDFGKVRGLTRASAQYPRQLLSPQALVSNDLCVMGDVRLLNEQAIGVVSSRRIPGRLIREAHDWAETMKLSGRVVVGGFHSPMERECLDVLLRGRTRIVVCPARGITTMRIPVDWRPLILSGRMAIVSGIEPGLRRSTEALAVKRNALVASLAETVLIIHASAGSATERLAGELVRRGKKLVTFGGPENDRLLRLGAEIWDW